MIEPCSVLIFVWVVSDHRRRRIAFFEKKGLGVWIRFDEFSVLLRKTDGGRRGGKL